MSSRTLYAQHPVSLRIFHLSPVLAYVFLLPGKSSTVQCTVFYTLQPKLMHLCTAVGSMLKTLCSKWFVSRAWRFIIYTCTTAIFSRTLYAQNPVSLRNLRSLLGSRCIYVFLLLLPSSPGFCRCLNNYAIHRRRNRTYAVLQFVYVHLRHKQMNALSTEPCFPIAVEQSLLQRDYRIHLQQD